MSQPSHRRVPLPVVAIVGATGAVGVELLRCLERRQFPLSKLRLFASARSAGLRLEFASRQLVVEELRADTLDAIDIALLSAGSDISQRFAPMLVERGAVVIDNSSAFRMWPDVPLVVPEVNGSMLARRHRLIANPNCATIIGAPELRVSATCVRVPVLRAHSMALTLECERPVTAEQVRALLNGAPGVELIDDPSAITFRCLGTPLDETMFWLVASGRTRATRRDALFHCSSQATNCSKVPPSTPCRLQNA
jgi:aspartate-semialdehyde dehydrogenase